MSAHELLLAPWEPHGRSLWDYHGGKLEAAVLLRSSLGEQELLPAAAWFREPAQFFPLERKALELARGRVLDVGAGTGVHTLPLEQRGLRVVAIDLLPQAIAILQARGARDARLAAWEEFQGGPFDTVLVLANGAGLARSLEGLPRFLAKLLEWTAPKGQVLIDSTDLTPLAKGLPPNPAGAYIGDLWFQLEYEGQQAPKFAQLYLDSPRLLEAARAAGFSQAKVVQRGQGGSYLAQLVR